MYFFLLYISSSRFRVDAWGPPIFCIYLSGDGLIRAYIRSVMEFYVAFAENIRGVVLSWGENSTILLTISALVFGMDTLWRW